MPGHKAMQDYTNNYVRKISFQCFQGMGRKRESESTIEKDCAHLSVDKILLMFDKLCPACEQVVANTRELYMEFGTVSINEVMSSPLI